MAFDEECSYQDALVERAVHEQLREMYEQQAQTGQRAQTGPTVAITQETIDTVKRWRGET